MIERDGRLIPVEIKSSATFSTDFVSGIRHFRSIYPEVTEPGFVLYNGTADVDAVYDNVRIVNPVNQCSFFYLRCWFRRGRLEGYLSCGRICAIGGKISSAQ